MKEKLPYSVPEGYFDSLKERLYSIPYGQQNASVSSCGVAATGMKKRWVVGISALAACLGIGVFIGKVIFEERPDYTAENEMIIEYLVESGTTLSQIENCFELIN